MTDPTTPEEPTFIYCENCDEEIVAEEAVFRNGNALWCQTCDDNDPFDSEDDE